MQSEFSDLMSVSRMLMSEISMAANDGRSHGPNVRELKGQALKEHKEQQIKAKKVITANMTTRIFSKKEK